MSNIINFTPKPLALADYMQRYRAECARTGEPASPKKAKIGDAGIIITSHGDLINVSAPSDLSGDELKRRPVKDLLDHWYGDGCPPWTWPLTSIAISAALIFGLPLLFPR